MSPQQVMLSGGGNNGSYWQEGPDQQVGRGQASYIAHERGWGLSREGQIFVQSLAESLMNIREAFKIEKASLSDIHLLISSLVLYFLVMLILTINLPIID